MAGCHDPSTAWPAFAQRERRKKPAIPVGMTESERAQTGGSREAPSGRFEAQYKLKPEPLTFGRV